MFLDDEKKALMEEIVDLASEIGDNCGNGSAWIGFTGSVRYLHLHPRRTRCSFFMEFHLYSPDEVI